MQKQLKDYLKLFAGLLGTFCIFAPFILPAPAGIPVAIFRVLGITIGGMMFWLFISVDWPNLLVLLGLMLVPELGPKTVLATSLGSDTVFFLILCFLLSGSLVKTGAARRIAIWFITSRTARRGPWFTVNMIFIAVFVLSSVLSATATVMIFLPILYVIFEELGFKKADNATFPAVMVCGLVVIAQIAQASTPVSHAMTIIGMSTYTTYTGEVIDFLQYCAVCLPAAIVCVVAWCLLVKFVFKPDMSRVNSIDYDGIAASIGPMKANEKVAVTLYCIVIVMWAVPGLSKVLAPSIAPILSKLNQNYVPIIAVVLLHVIKVDGEPVYDFIGGLRNVSWSLIFFMGAILALGSAYSNADIGMSGWLSTTIGPLVSNMSPLAFTIVIVCITMLMTNAMSNAVCIAVCHAVAMPLVATVFAGRINPALVSILITTSASFAFATPPATPPAAVAAGSGWLSLGRMFYYGITATVVSAVIVCVIGISLGGIVLG